MAISAAMMLKSEAMMKAPFQPPVSTTSTLASGTSSDAVPFAVYSRPALVVAYLTPNQSVQAAGKRL